MSVFVGCYGQQEQSSPLPVTINTTVIRGIEGIFTNSACDSVSYPSNGRTYSRVCGKIIAYQRGSTDAFTSLLRDNAGFEGPYVDGISSVTITSATLLIMMQDIFLGCIIQMTLCLTDRGVVLIVPAACSTLLHGFARNYHNQPVTILR